MSGERTPEADQLYTQGLEHLRAGRWEEAVKTLTLLQLTAGPSPMVEALIDDARLKMEVGRSKMPQGALPPRPRQIPYLRLGAILVVLLVAADLMIIALRQAPNEPSEASLALQAALPIKAMEPTPTPKPKPTAAPTAAPAPTAVPQPGTLLVRMAEGQSVLQSTRNVEIILDASGSMMARIDEQRKIDIARDALVTLVEQLPEQTNVALRSYGHRRTDDCTDVELRSPLAPLDRAAMIELVRGTEAQPEARTPIDLSLQQITDDLKGAEGDVLVILLSDGEESCDGDPVKTAAQIHADNPRIRINVIGFNIGPDDARARLSEIAQAGGGRYFDAADATQLVATLQQAVTMTYRVVNTENEQVYSGDLGSAASLAPGRYAIQIDATTPLTIGEIEVGDGKTTIVEVREEGGVLRAAITPAVASP
jgi:Ca-activated chloride channel homolog